jgi:HlyD family secretion protein
MEEHGSSRHACLSLLRWKKAAWLGSVILLALISPIGIATTLRAWQAGSAGEGQPGVGASGTSGEIHALARLEPLSGLIMLGARPGARIERIEVRQGSKVAVGQLLAVLEGHDQATAQLSLAEGQKARAVHQRSVAKQKLALESERFDKLHKARADSTMRIMASKALFDEITASYKQLQPTLQGKERLDLQLKYLEAERQIIRDSLEVKAAQLDGELAPRQRKLELDELGDKSPDLDVLDRQIELARSGVAQAEVRAPAAGLVLELLSHAGEVSTGALLAMGDVSAMAAVAEVFQADVPRLKIGDPASVLVLDQPVAGRVTQIGSMVARNQLANLDPRALQDRRVVKVTISLDDPALAAKLVNMEVEVTIRPGETAAAAPRAPAP